MKKSFILLLPAIFALLFASCKSPEKPVTPEEAEEIAGTIAASAANKNPEYLNRLLSVEALSRKIEKISGIRFSAAEKAAFSKGLRKRKIGNEIMDKLGKGSLRLLHHYERNNKQHLLFRGYYENGGINYFDLTLIREDEKIKIEDVLVYGAGEPISVIASRTFRDLSKNKYDEKEIGAATEMRDLIARQAYQEAYNIYETLSPAVQNQKVFMLLKVEIVTGLNDEALYVQTLEAYKSLFPKEVNIPLLMFEAYFLKGDYEKVLASIDQLDRLVQKDPFLDYYRGLCYKEMGDTDQYVAVLEKLYQYDPNFQDGLLELIAAYLKQRQPAKAKEMIEVYRAHLGYDQELLNNYLKTAEGVSKDMLAA